MQTNDSDIGRQRIQRIQERMAMERIDWIYVGEGPNMAFATGHVAKPPAARLDKVRLKTALIPAVGPPAFICPVLLAPNVQATSWVEEIITPSSANVHFDEIAQILSRGNGGMARIGVDEKLMLGIVERLQGIMTPGSELVNITSIFHDLRLVKDADEIALLRQSSIIANTALKKAIDSIEPGKTEIDVANEIVLGVREEGGDCTLAQVVSGAGRYPEDPTDKQIMKGDVITLDVNVAYRGYYSDETRVAVVGPADSEQQRVHKIVLEANEKARATVKSGVTGGEVHEAGAAVIRDHGYEKYFTHGIGHGLGVEGHEAPYLASGSNEALQSGMVHTIEPAIYGRTVGKFTIRLEDVVLTTETGCELLTTLSHDLIQV